VAKPECLSYGSQELIKNIFTFTVVIYEHVSKQKIEVELKKLRLRP